MPPRHYATSLTSCSAAFPPELARSSSCAWPGSYSAHVQHLGVRQGTWRLQPSAAAATAFVANRHVSVWRTRITNEADSLAMAFFARTCSASYRSWFKNHVHYLLDALLSGTPDQGSTAEAVRYTSSPLVLRVPAFCLAVLDTACRKKHLLPWHSGSEQAEQRIQVWCHRRHTFS